jgi:hypothetical protein
VPISEAGDLNGLNELLLVSCIENRSHLISVRAMTIGAAMEEERPHPPPPAEEGFEL